jgi:Ca2+-transporting ATPase
VLALATGVISSPPLTRLEVRELTFLGLVGLADPLRNGMRELVSNLHRAGIRTVLITGDQSATARSIAMQVGLCGEASLQVVDAGAPDAFNAGQQAHVFARVSPEQKLLIVRALQAAGETVAMIGDGINDSPALRAADVGITLGQGGTSAAREVADVVLETDDLSSLLLTIESGRTTYANIRKAIHYLLGTNLSEVLVMLGGSLAGAAEALSPMQLLWINLLTDVLPGLGLVLEPPEPGVLGQLPMRAHARIVDTRNYVPLARDGALISAGALAAFGYGGMRYGMASAQTRTMTFTSLIAAQLLHALTCRSSKPGSLRARPPNRALSAVLALSAAAQVGAFATPGLRRLLGLTALAPLDWAVVAAAGLGPFLARRNLRAPSSLIAKTAVRPGCRTTRVKAHGVY